MCGIAGIVGYPDQGGLDLVVNQMIATLEHRGPDDSGVWSDARAGVALGHRRLSIVDLSAAGHQPMTSACGTYVLTFNGEIYNHRDLRHELERSGGAPEWRGHSDTEVFLAAVCRWGVRTALERSVGMFAFGLWDCANRTLHLARDRLGEKPLYLGTTGDSLVFASELKALRVCPGWGGGIDRGALVEFMRFGCISSPRSIYSNVVKIPPASLLSIPCDDFGAMLSSADPARAECYWDAVAVAEAGTRAPLAADDSEARDLLAEKLTTAVGQQMQADVPLGSFLSGGVDSSLVTALMQTRSGQKIKTFSIGFEDPAYNEATYAKAVARHLGTDHTEQYLTAEDAMAVIPRLPILYDEPFADASQIPTFLVSELARRHVTVAL
ncbi:MAG TPA: asparagine synthase (glutamine-hydrolyzing), partial [Gammaproteobacteria bacterium]